MTPERAMEILNPKHREHYESIDPVNEACKIGMKAIDKHMVAKKPKNTVLGLRCPICNIKSHDAWYNYCPHCGQKLDWSDFEQRLYVKWPNQEVNECESHSR